MSDVLWSIIYFGGILFHQVFIVCLLWRAKKHRAYSNDLIWTGGLLLIMLTYELYREMMRVVGFPQPITPSRLMWFRLVYLALGLFYGEVGHYVEKVRHVYRKE